MSGKKILSLVRKFGERKHADAWRQISGEVDISTFEDVFSQEVKTKDKPQVKLPEEFLSLVGQPESSHSKPIKYLMDRGVTRQDINKWKIGYCHSGEFANRIIVPSFDCEGNLDYFIARLYISGWNKYKNPPVSRDIIFNDLNIDWNKEIILVEGAFDAMRAENAIPLLGSTMKETSRLFTKIVEKSSTVYIALDKDAKRKEQVIIDNLLQHDIATYKIPLGNFSDVGEMSKEEFAHKKTLASFITREDYLLHKALTL
jgi:DNA primase